MKTKQSVEQSYQGCLKNAEYHACRVLDNLTALRNGGPLDTEDNRLRDLREHLGFLTKFSHEMNAYHNVMYTE